MKRGAVACALVVTLGLPASAQAQVAANQLCMAAGYGPGCIGAFRPTPMPRVAPTVRAPTGGMRPGVSVRPNVGGLVGGIVASVIASIVIDHLINEMVNSAGTEAQQPGFAPDRVNAFQRAIEQQRAAQDLYAEQLMSAMHDAPATKLVDDPSDLALDEAASERARLGFDTGSPSAGDGWRLHDPWFSPEPGYANAVEGARPLALGDQRVPMPAPRSLKCAGGLCEFPPGTNPEVTIRPVQGSGGTPKTLGSGAPDVPMPSIRLAEPRETQKAECEGGIQAESPSGFVAAARAKWVGAQSDPRLAADLVVNVMEKFPAMPEPAATVAGLGRKTYRDYMDRLLCGVIGVLKDAVLDPDAAIAKSDRVLAWAESGMADSAARNVGTWWLNEVKDYPKKLLLKWVKDDIAEAREPKPTLEPPGRVWESPQARPIWQWARDEALDAVKSKDYIPLEPSPQRFIP